MKTYDIYMGHPNTKMFKIKASKPDTAASKFVKEHDISIGSSFVVGSEYAPPFFKYTVTKKAVKRVQKIDWDITRGILMK